MRRKWASALSKPHPGSSYLEGMPEHVRQNRFGRWSRMEVSTRQRPICAACCITSGEGL